MAKLWAASALPLLLSLCLGSLFSLAAGATCGYGPFGCPLGYGQASPITTCTTCGVQECCKSDAVWTTVTPNPNLSPARWLHCSVNVSGQVLVIAGLTSTDWNGAVPADFLNDVWATTTSTSYSLRTSAAAFSPRAWLGCAVMGTTVYVIAGYDGPTQADLNDVWSSTDLGASFTQLTANTGFLPRDSFGVTVFKGSLWVVAGWSNGTFLNDVWYSNTGATWAQMTTVGAIFSPRQGLSLVVFQDKMVLVGGETATVTLNDVWYTLNGATWISVVQVAPFSPRGYASVFVAHSLLFLAGGEPGVSHSPASPSALSWATADLSTWVAQVSLPTAVIGQGTAYLSTKNVILTNGYSGSALLSTDYVQSMATVCGSYNCPVPYASLAVDTVCSGATCTNADCCSTSLGARSTKIAAIVLAVACSIYNPVTLVQKIEALTGVPAQTQAVTFFGCSSLTAYIAVVGTTPALADAALALIVQAALSGLLGPVVSVTLVDFPFPPPTPVPTYPEYPTIPIFRPPSTSNPALLALLTLLVIPLAICLGLICSHARRPQCMVPVSCAPAPMMTPCC